MLSTDYNILFAFLTSLIITYFAIPKVILLSKRFRLSDVPGERASHEGSIPIFGGVAIFVGILFSLLFWSEVANIQYVIISLVIIFFTGIIDDLIGLTPYKKLIFQCIAILIIIYFGHIQIDNMHTVLGVQELPDIIATMFTVFVVVVITNGFNLIDGVDGLAGGIGIISAFCFGIVALLMGDFDMAMIAFSLIGSLLAFLRYNFYPAKIFMGDTGSLSLGGSLGAVGIITKHEIVLAITGGLFVLEAISVIAQVISFKLTGKRIFKMAPIHHHFEKKGWAESTVVVRFWIISIILAMIGLATLKLR